MFLITECDKIYNNNFFHTKYYDNAIKLSKVLSFKNVICHNKEFKLGNFNYNGVKNEKL